MKSVFIAIAALAFVTTLGTGATVAQEPRNEDALKKAGAYDNVDPGYAKPMDQRGAPGAAGATVTVFAFQRVRLSER